MSDDNKSSTKVTEKKKRNEKGKKADRKSSIEQAEEGEAGAVTDERRPSTEPAEESVVEQGEDRDAAAVKKTEKKEADGEGLQEIISDPKKLAIIAVGVLTLLLIIILAAALSSGGGELHAYEKKSCDEDDPTSAEVNSCLKQNCTFDETGCGTSCPFGYQLGEDGCEESCECALEGVMEGDIPFTPTDVESMVEEYGLVQPEQDFEVFASSDKTSNLWQHHEHYDPTGFVIYYDIDGYPDNKLYMIEELFERIEEKTCLKFELGNKKRPYFVFSNKSAGCTSEVGYKGIWRQTINLGPSCFSMTIIRHQLLHLLGLAHEHTRSDRNAYVNIMEENIAPGRLANFLRRTDLEHASHSPYDLSSILQYDGYIYSKNNEATIRRVVDGKPLPRQWDYSDGDIEELNTLYGCLEYEPDEAQWTAWSEWSLCGSGCNEAGFRSRYRRCENSSPELVTGCEGSNVESEECIGRCATQTPSARAGGGQWEYGPAGKCTATCGGGIALRRGTCVPAGARCSGPPYKREACNKQSCGYEETPYWAQWTEWGECSATCGEDSIRKRERYCYNRLREIRRCGPEKLDMMMQTEDCDKDACFAVFGHISDYEFDITKSIEENLKMKRDLCSASCDGTRTVVNCVYMFCDEETIPCNEGACKHLHVEPQMFKSDKEPIADVLCGGKQGNIWRFADFNGDKRVDVMCFTSVGSVKVGYSNSAGKLAEADWEGMLSSCGKDVHVGDFNGDGNADVLCRDSARRIKMHLASENGCFGKNTMSGGHFCTGHGDVLMIMDVNADGKMDLVCHLEDKSIELSLNTM